MIDEITVLIVLNQLFIAMYIFELFYRAKLSPIAVAHHIGAIMIAQSSVAMSLNWQHERDATIEFDLCFVWGMLYLVTRPFPFANTIHSIGAFDIVAEFWPHIAIIMYRLYPTDHHILCRIFLFSCITTFIGTVFETVIIMWLFGSLWHRWTLPFKIVTPILHVVFSAAQLWGAKNFHSMWLKQRRLLKEHVSATERRASYMIESNVRDATNA
jgi:hypothetical protein